MTDTDGARAADKASAGSEEALAAAGEAVDEQDAAIIAGTAPHRSWVPTRARSADPAQVYSVRIPTALITALRKAADARDMTVSALIREWTSERLVAELNNDSAAQPPDPTGLAVSALRTVADLLEDGSLEPDPTMLAKLLHGGKRASGTVRQPTLLTSSTTS